MLRILFLHYLVFLNNTQYPCQSENQHEIAQNIYPGKIQTGKKLTTYLLNRNNAKF